ncbi:uncharacterized protein DEA37_0010049 [Paragonimus westermani]|uniref:TTI1 N-terminal TPR domain-containing protein n=1 Tax=Paragonimus westermani TaxID=34504 RepID=A0A5J4N5V1_9TREM|nr:uncharacterized protein DEA37_0010049 [Paragonimus westermani]
MATDPMFLACLQLRRGHWEEGMHKLLSCTQSSTKNDLPMLFNILHPLLRRFIRRNVVHKSDSIELFYRVYGNLFELQTAFVEPVNAIQVIDDLSSFLFLLSEKVKTTEPPWKCLSDECCLVIFRTVERLLSCLTKDAVLIVYSNKQLPLLSHICSTALEMAEFSHSRAVRVQALQTIRHLAQPISRGECMVSERISAVVAQLLPGVSQSLYRIVTGDSKIGSTVKEAAFDSWTATFLAVFGHTLEPETSCINAESLSVLVSSRDLFHRLCTSLADLLCFNTSSVELFNDPPQLDFLSSSSFVRARNTMQTVHLFTKSFTAFRDPKSLWLIQAIAGRIAGQENTVDLFLGTCRDVMMLQTGGILRNSCILLITAGLSGYLANGKSLNPPVDHGRSK